MQSELKERLQAALAELSGPQADPSRLQAQQRRLLDAVQEGARHRGRRTRLYLSLAAAGAVVVLLIVGIWLGAEPSDAPCRLDDGTVLAAGDWVEAGEQERRLSFSEGSHALLERGSRVRLVRSDASETLLSVEAGRLRSRVDSGARRKWIFLAGPFRVRVTGTQLAVSWDIRAQQFEVAVTKGSVLVNGDGIPADGIRVMAGERLQADRKRGEVRHLRPLPQPAERPAEREDAAPIAADSEAGTDTAAPSRTAARPKRARRTVARWKTLAERGRLKEALAEVTHRGFDRLVEQLPAWDLLLLADTARLGGRLAWARTALLALRQRFAGQRPAQLAAFRLGRLAFDRNRDYAKAARWLRTFLREAPTHSLAENARGRLMLALQRSGDHAAARAHAREYLRSHTGGSYSGSARAILERGDRP